LPHGTPAADLRNRRGAFASALYHRPHAGIVPGRDIRRWPSHRSQRLATTRGLDSRCGSRSGGSGTSGLHGLGSGSIALYTARPRSVSATAPAASREIRPTINMWVTISRVTPACSQSVRLAAQNNSTRSRTDSISAVLAGVVSFAIADLVWLGLSLAGARPGIGADDAAVTHHQGAEARHRGHDGSVLLLQSCGSIPRSTARLQRAKGEIHSFLRPRRPM
jgi:hypothetical protein